MVGKLIVIGGGARSGKSGLALDLARERGSGGVFIATAEAFDDEMRERIEVHRRDRGDDLATIEEPRELARVISEAPDGAPVIVDCLTLWLSNLLLAGLGEGNIAERVDGVLERIGARSGDTIVVTNEVGMGIVPSSRLGRAFRDLAGRAHQTLAHRADEMYLGVMGMILRVVPGPIAVVPRGDAP